ncbi:hypothetical protein MTR67_003329 [Solanum verrucosum]|uniref:Tf2-1-like SH3-like domain-containing protein n=1 Tax=Solanum verrucosum TaxID=315347 RepID=A0AAF0PRU2_SOLVR|nr:hypothetical protein MTR67_003329 [Solanum verrucosum]
MKGVVRFDNKRKLSPRYVGPYKILKRIGKVAYELESPTELAEIHPVFHISLLKKCVGDPASIVPLESVAVKDSLSYKDVPVEILDHQVRRLRNKEVDSVKVLWRSQSVEGATWEAEAAMKAKYHHLFPSDPLQLEGRPRPVLVVRGSPLQPHPKPAQKSRLSPNSRTDPRSVDQTTVRGMCLWIETSFTQPLTQTMVDQHGPSFDPWSVGLTVDEGQLPVS